MEKNIEVLVMGDVLLDSKYWIGTLPKAGGDETITYSAVNPGGSAANTAKALRSQGIGCAFCGRFGNDTAGRQIAANMEAQGIDLGCADWSGETGYTITMIDSGGERTMFSYRGTGDYLPVLKPVMIETLKEAKILYVSGYLLLEKPQAELATEAAKAAQNSGCYVMFDPSPIVGRIDADILNNFLSLTSVIFPNLDELLTMSKCKDINSGIKTLLETVPCIAVKLGAEGSRLVARAGFRLPQGSVPESGFNYSAPAESVTPVDTTGGGDAFNGGFIASFLRGTSPLRWLITGNSLAAALISKKPQSSL
jgi:sugar/nucleoside kinase (ribokinase family)